MRKITEEQEKQILVQMLKEIDKFCYKYNIRYYAAYGTLLGAVRHEGFIPWDDDIDLVMKRYDYDRFIELFIKEKYLDICLATSSLDSRYPYTYAKVYYEKSVLIEHLYKPYTMGINIDIFPIDNWGKKIDKDFNLINFYKKILKGKVCKISGYRNFIMNACLIGMQSISCLFDRKALFDKINYLSQQENMIDTDFIGNISSSDSYGLREKMKTIWFNEVIRLKFMDITIDAPAEYDSILSKLYGDYMTLPPKNKRISHHFSEYWLKDM